MLKPLLGLVLVAWLGAAWAPAAETKARPNVVFVLIDDLRWDEIDYPFVELPNIQRLAREGVRFRNAFVTTPLCSPSRASFLTGQYAHAHGIIDNTDRSPRSHELVTFPRLLHDAGYETAFLGKWHMGVDDGARPGFDHWISVKGQGRYLDPEFNVNGESVAQLAYQLEKQADVLARILAGGGVGSATDPRQGRNLGLSAIVALNSHEFLVLERDNRGIGVDNPQGRTGATGVTGSKGVFKIDVNGATDVTGLSLPLGDLPAGIVPVQKSSSSHPSSTWRPTRCCRTASAPRSGRA